MNSTFRRAIAALGIVTLTGAFTPAHAGCGIDWGHGTASGWLGQQAIVGAGGTTLAAASAGFRWDDRVSSDRSIVGLWKFTFTAEGNEMPPDGVVVDAGYATWHSDGTELMNSSRPPASSSFCMGVYKRVGRATYQLNHFALSWDPTGQAFIGPTNIRETVTVDHTGNSYSGTFAIDQYAEDGTTVIAHLTGRVDAQRITAD